MYKKKTQFYGVNYTDDCPKKIALIIHAKKKFNFRNIIH